MQSHAITQLELVLLMYTLNHNVSPALLPFKVTSAQFRKTENLRLEACQADIL